MAHLVERRRVGTGLCDCINTERSKHMGAEEISTPICRCYHPQEDLMTDAQGEERTHSTTINVRNLGFMIQSISFGMILGGYFRWPSLFFEFVFALMVVGTIVFWYGE